MAGQAIERREIMRILALAAAASRSGVFGRWVFADEPAGTDAGEPQRTGYVPQFFSPDDYATVEILTELIIPNDGTPGAREAGVAEFIDFMAANDPEIRVPLRNGLAWLNAHSLFRHGVSFRTLSAEQQTGILEPLAYRERFRPGQEPGRTFFQLIRDYTVRGYYTSRVGMRQIGFPGFKTYSESPGCPHQDDPEHRRLRPDQG